MERLLRHLVDLPNKWLIQEEAERRKKDNSICKLGKVIVERYLGVQ